ncbi:MAG: hypothetical protein V7707_08215 [Motiliproteus sp.]
MFNKKNDRKFCPLLKKACVGNECMFATQLRGQDPTSGEEIDEEACAVAVLPMLLIESTKAQHQTGAAVESFRNETVRTHQDLVLAAINGQMGLAPTLINHG